MTARIGLLSSVRKIVRIGPDALRAITSEDMPGLGTDDAMAFISSKAVDGVVAAGFDDSEMLLNAVLDVDG
jgi:hypothetical protein